jgi:hypothetical protein
VSLQGGNVVALTSPHGGCFTALASSGPLTVKLVKDFGGADRHALHSVSVDPRGGGTSAARLVIDVKRLGA